MKPVYLEDHQACCIEAAVQGVLFTSIYLPNGNPQPGPKFTYEAGLVEQAFIAHAAEPGERRACGAGRGATMNVVPTPQDILIRPRSLDNNALIQPESRQQALRRLPRLPLDRRHEEAGIRTGRSYISGITNLNGWQKDKGMRLDRPPASSFKFVGPLVDGGAD